MIEIDIENVESSVIQGVGSTGLFKHYRTNLPLSIILNWDGEAYCYYLEGEYANRFFVIDARNPPKGSLIRNPRIVVDWGSSYDSVHKFDPLGALVVTGGCAHIVGTAMGNGFADPILVPLWVNGMEGRREEKLGFTRWKLVLDQGHRDVELWRQSGADIGE